MAGLSSRLLLGGRVMVLALITVALGPVLNSAALEVPDYVLDTWQTDAGLPNNAVTALLQTADHYLWTGTSNGVARFDGVRFNTFRTLDNPGLRSNCILCLLQDAQGVLWLGTEDGGLSSFRGGQFTTWTTAQGLSADTVLCLGEEPGGGLWAGTAAGLNRFQGGQWTTYFQIDGLPDDAVSAICRRRNASLLFACNSGLCRFVGERLATETSASAFIPGTVGCLLEDRTGCLWMAGVKGLCRVAPGTNSSPSLSSRLCEDKVLVVLERKDGAIWFGTSKGGLYSLPAGTEAARAQLVTRFPGAVTALCEDCEGNLWVGSATDGLHRLKRRQFRCSPLPAGAEAANGPSAFETARGELELLSSEGLVYRCEQGRFNLLERWPLPAGLVLRTACRSADGTLWVGTTGNGLWQCRNGKLRQFTEHDGLSGNSIEVLLADPEGGVWLGMRNGGLNYLQTNSVRRFNTPWGFTGNFACALIQDRDGALWIGTTGDGLFQYRQDAFQAFTSGDGLPSPEVRVLQSDADGTLWVGTARGLARVRHGQVASCTGRNGLPAEAVWQLRGDREGNLWIGSSSSILRVRKDQLLAYVDGRSPIIDAVPYGREDGLPGLQCVPQALSQVSRPSGEALWFLTTRGLVTPAQAGFDWNALPPAVTIEQVLVDNEEVPATSPIRLPPGRDGLQLRYTALSLSAPGKVAFRYRLDGFDQDWSEVTSSRTARYPKLPAGNYTFEVIARNNDGQWNETGAHLAVAVLPFWWNTNWFRLGTAGAVAVLLTGLYQLRRKRLRELERLRVRIASDLHDDLGSSLWSITLLSRLVAQSPTLSGEERQDVSEIHRIAVQTSNSIRDIIWLINPAFDTLQELVLRTKDFAGTALRGIDYRVDCDGVELGRKLPLDFRQNLFLLLKEALTNVARHANARRVEVRLREQGGHWHLRVQDDGVGFEPNAVAGGNGRKSMSARAQKLGAQLQSESHPGQGTTIVLTIPIPRRA